MVPDEGNIGADGTDGRVGNEVFMGIDCEEIKLCFPRVGSTDGFIVMGLKILDLALIS